MMVMMIVIIKKVTIQVMPRLTVVVELTKLTHIMEISRGNVAFV